MSRPSRPLALITGASRGIGLAIATRLAPSHDLLLVGRHASRLDEVARELPQTRLETAVVDLAEDTTRRAFVAELEARPRPVDVLVNNAGVAPSAPLHRTDNETWSRTIALNLTAPFELTRAVVPAMRSSGWGRIVNIASTAALKGYKFTAAYSASKGGLLGLSRALAAELASSGITVNAVCPGFTDTDIVAHAVQNIHEKTGRSSDEARASLEQFSPMGRLVRPDEVAALVAYLVSPEADALSGAALPLDGGETA